MLVKAINIKLLHNTHYGSIPSWPQQITAMKENKELILGVLGLMIYLTVFIQNNETKIFWRHQNLIFYTFKRRTKSRFLAFKGTLGDALCSSGCSSTRQVLHPDVFYFSIAVYQTMCRVQEEEILQLFSKKE